MKTIFRKAMTVLGSAALVGATVGAAVAASTFPDPFTSGSAIVVGANAAPQDNAAALSIASYVDGETAGGSMTTLTGAQGVSEDEVILGGQIDFTGSKVESTMTDTKIPSLLDEKFSWDDGNGADDYDFHEEIIIGDMAVLTTLDDEDLDGVALSNNMALEYRYVFDDALNVSGIGTDDADDLYLTILGQTYQVESMTSSTITVVTSDEISLAIGESTTVGGKVFTVDDVYDGKAQVNGEVISEGSTKKINGLRVKVDTVGYHSNQPELSKVILVIGEDITKTYSDGDEYIGEDEDDPLWVWTISDPTTALGYIGVKYNVNINDADDDIAGDTIKYEGAGYILPDNFAEVRLEGITNVDYEDVKVEFAQQDLYNSSDNSVINEDEWVVKVTAETTSTLSVGAEETDELYIWYANNASNTEGSAAQHGSIELFYRDHDGDNTPTNKARYETRIDLTGEGAVARTNAFNISVGDTDIEVDVYATGGETTLYFKNPTGDDIAVDIDGTDIAISGAGTVGTFKQFGETLEDADALDVTVGAGATDISTQDAGSVMDYYGIIVSDGTNPEAEIDRDELTLSIPTDQVYAEVSVVAGGEAETTGEAGIMTVKDNAVSTVAGKNLIVVGGSAINSVAAELLGGAYSEAQFTSMTGVGAGEFMIESFSRGGKTALLVAGYEAADTTRGATYLINKGVDTGVGNKLIGTSATEATVVTSA